MADAVTTTTIQDGNRIAVYSLLTHLMVMVKVQSQK